MENKKTNYVIDVISDKIKEIFKEHFEGDSCPPTFFISQIMMFNEDNERCGTQFILTLVHSDEEYAFDYRQSDFITLHTDLEAVITQLYNRTM